MGGVSETNLIVEGPGSDLSGLPTS